MSCSACGGTKACQSCKGSGKCAQCGGKGTVEDNCQHCGNYGDIDCDACTSQWGINDTPGVCAECDGTQVCMECDGDDAGLDEAA